jgi:hypothetical protein
MEFRFESLHNGFAHVVVENCGVTKKKNIQRSIASLTINIDVMEFYSLDEIDDPYICTLP